MTCVEENIFELISKLAKAANSIPLYILTTKENRRVHRIVEQSKRYIKISAMVFACKNRNFHLTIISIFPKMVKYQIHITLRKEVLEVQKRYLKDVRRIFCTQDSCNRMYPK